MSRCRLLRTCGNSFLAIAQIICKRMQELKAPIGPLSKKIISLSTCALPFKYGFQIQWLSILLYIADECILKSETITETAFPRLTPIFDKIHELANVVDRLPIVFEATLLNKFPVLMHRVPFLDWALVHLIAWLSFLVSALTHWGSKNMKEKEITVDTGCNDHNHVRRTKKTEISATENASFQTHVSPFPALQCTKGKRGPVMVSSPQSSSPSDSTKMDCTDMSSMNGSVGKCSYKEVLTKGVKDGDSEVFNNAKVKKHGIIPLDNYLKTMSYEEEEDKREGLHIPSDQDSVHRNKKGKVEKDEILQLFDTSWSLC
ncbi:unnamed protein product [Cuscuta epithymum]|uniref:Uncharacterized protein n=1 Tax=Cuscuta epithymum TaxID=186058 RepID=A0AAV0CIV2_9ASTE|nr:unnamed protein product [Cuscuta epithymum]